MLDERRGHVRVEVETGNDAGEVVYDNREGAVVGELPIKSQ